MSYHQSQDYLTDEQLIDYRSSATRQEDLIYQFYKANLHLSFSPEQINEKVLPSVPLTSVRRAISNLASAGDLERVGVGPGVYGRPVGLWRFKPKVQEGFLF